MISTLALVLAEENPDEMARLIDDAGPIAGLFVLILGIVMFFLWRSMSKQIKRIDPTLPAGPDDREQLRDRELTQEAMERDAAAPPQPDDPPGS